MKKLIAIFMFIITIFSFTTFANENKTITFRNLDWNTPISTFIDNIEFKSDTIIDGMFQYELFVSSKNETYEVFFNEENNTITGGLIRARSDLSYAELNAETAQTLSELIQLNLK